MNDSSTPKYLQVRAAAAAAECFKHIFQSLRLNVVGNVNRTRCADNKNLAFESRTEPNSQTRKR